MLNEDLTTPDCLDAFHRWIEKNQPLANVMYARKAFAAGYNNAKADLDERNQTIAMLSQQLADKKEIIRRLTT